VFRIRFHGRGGQGVKTASRMLGTAFFMEGYEVQDAPRYGAERRGAPIFAYVRADKAPIYERGVIPHPDLVLVADDTLVGIPAADVLQGIDAHCVLAINSAVAASLWGERLAIEARVVILPPFSAEEPAERPYVGAVLAGAAARLLGLNKGSITEAINHELEGLGEAIIASNVEKAQATFDVLAGSESIVAQRDDSDVPVDPDWIELKHEGVERSAPTIHAAATSTRVKTGLWRTLRPVIDMPLCKRCNWMCGSFCPDNAVLVDDEGYPFIDYDHCKGCLICLAQCPSHAIHAEVERGEVV
jgi:pyruvate ferredoxin oxidoreductase gamma subunit